MRRPIPTLMMAAVLLAGYSQTTTHADEKDSATKMAKVEKPQEKRDSFPFHGKVGKVDTKS